MKQIREKGFNFDYFYRLCIIGAVQNRIFRNCILLLAYRNIIEFCILILEQSSKA